jgi:hypothetical protein
MTMRLSFTRHLKSIARLSALIVFTAFPACTTYKDRVPPVPLPSFRGDYVNVQDAMLAASAYADPEAAREAFGFDIRGAGLLPVRFVIDNQGRNVVKVSPQQTFLIDRQGLAWPLLTTEQAQNRVAGAVQLGGMARNAGISALWGGAAGLLGGFAVSLLLDGGMGPAAHTNLLDQTVVGAGVGAFFGGAEDSQMQENDIRRNLIGKSMRNQRVQPGELAYGYLFFPGKQEAQSAVSLRLGLEIDGYPQVVNLPLITAARQAASPK